VIKTGNSALCFLCPKAAICIVITEQLINGFDTKVSRNKKEELSREISKKETQTNILMISVPGS
jgi:hypothetical protein